MRIPRIRMTTKRWMIVIAGLAVLLARPARFRYLAREHERAYVRLPFKDLEFFLLFTPAQGDTKHEERISEIRPIRDYANYHYSMSIKYEDASQRPWLPVAADSPAPPLPSQECLAKARRILDGIYREFEIRPVLPKGSPKPLARSVDPMRE